MLGRIFLRLAVFGVFAGVFVGVFSASVHAQSADDILQRHFQARGGIENLKSVSSIRYFGRITAAGIDVPIIVEQKRPKKLRVLYTQLGAQGIQAYDGTTGWAIPALKDRRDPESMDSDTLKATIEQADFDGPLVDYKEKGNSIAFVDREFVQNKPAYKLRLTLASGETSFVYIDTDSYLILREEVKRSIDGEMMETTTDFADYRRIGNLVIAHSIQTATKGVFPSKRITIDRVELNPNLDDAIFKMPRPR